MTTDPLDFKADWQCSKCKAVTTSDEIEELIEVLEREVSSLPMSKVKYEDTLARYSKVLHPNHHVMIDLEFTLVQLYGREKSDSQEEMVREAKRKLHLCEKVLGVIGKIMPGYFRMRGMFLSEMYGIILYLARRDFEAEVIDDREFLRQLKSAGALLDESIKILSFEPINTMEGSRCQTALEFRQQLDKLIGSLENKLKAFKKRNKR